MPRKIIRKEREVVNRRHLVVLLNQILVKLNKNRQWQKGERLMDRLLINDDSLMSQIDFE